MGIEIGALNAYASVLDHAALHAREVDRITLSLGELAIPDAYRIQDEVIASRVRRGEAVIGLKMGLTSLAKMRQMKVDSPIYGVLTDSMRIPAGGEIALPGRIHPKIEPEVAFILERDLSGPVDAATALSACSGVCAAMEIIDSRYRNFNFTLPDVIADNCSSSGFVLGEVIRSPSEVDLGNLGMMMEISGKGSQFGSSAAIYGHPAESLAELCRMLHARGLPGLKAGMIVLAGGATEAVMLEAGDRVSLSVQGLGTVSVTVSAIGGGVS